MRGLSGDIRDHERSASVVRDEVFPAPEALPGLSANRESASRSDGQRASAGLMTDDVTIERSADEVRTFEAGALRDRVPAIAHARLDAGQADADAVARRGPRVVHPLRGP